jgi:O-antigen chain-terminating methyltransferase
MDNLDHTKEYIEDFKKKIRSKAKKENASDLSYGLKNNNIYDYLGRAEQNAKIGADVPSFNRLSAPKRIVYRWITKFLFKVLRIITINQRQYNLSILDSSKSIIDECNNLKLKLAEAKTYFDTKIIEMEFKFKQQNIEIYEIKNTADYLKNSLVQIEQRINDIPEVAGKAAGKTSTGKLQNLTDEISHNLDSLYVFLEDNLRGRRDEIKKRLQVYIPIIKKSNTGLKNSPILDIGCGRGEWLELLKETGLHASGLDLNKIMIRICKERGFKVKEGEALSFLKDLSDHSLGAVTCFHLIEHYGFEFLVGLLKEILRVLKPGGLVILETPNPDNVLVGSCNFYLDPTHNKPLPSPLIKLVLESCGFSKVKIMPLNPYEDDARIKNDDFETSKRFNDYFYGPQDYAVVGYKI